MNIFSNVLDGHNMVANKTNKNEYCESDSNDVDAAGVSNDIPVPV